MQKAALGGWVDNLGMLRLLLLCALLAGCSDAPERPRANRKQAARALADQAPKRSIYRFDSGDLVVLDIATTTIGGYGDSQKCFLWRDSEFRSASMQCTNDSPADLGRAEPEKNAP